MVLPEGASNKVTWTTSDANVATVSAEGLVQGIKAGTATITVETVDGGKKATCTVTVKEKQTVSTSEPTAADLVPGNSNYSNIKIDNIQKSGNYLVGFDVSYEVGNYIAAAPARISVNTQVFKASYSDNSYGDFTNMGEYAEKHNYTTFPNTPADCGFVTWNAPFTDGKITFQRSGGGTKQELTIVFPENTIPLDKEKTYYVYLWANYGNETYPDTFLYTFTTNKGEFVPETTSEDETIGDSDWNVLQANYTSLVDAYNAVTELYNSKEIKADKDIEALLNQAKTLIEQIGNIKRENLTASQGQELNGAMLSILDALDNIIDAMEIKPAT